jgi:hypothetical protein
MKRKDFCRDGTWTVSIFKTIVNLGVGIGLALCYLNLES